MIKLSYITLYVEELKPVRQWYVDHIGLTAVWESEAFVLLAGDGEARLGLHRGTPLSEPERVQLHFQVSDIDETVEQLRSQAVEFDQGPKETSWGYRMVMLSDPVGHVVELYEPLPDSSY